MQQCTRGTVRTVKRICQPCALPNPHSPAPATHSLTPATAAATRRIRHATYATCATRHTQEGPEGAAYEPEEALRKLKDHWVATREFHQAQLREKQQRYQRRLKAHFMDPQGQLKF